MRSFRSNPTHPSGGLDGLPPRLFGRAFSLVELIIVVVILAVIVAIAVPRMSSAADRARENSLAQTVVGLQKALDLYAIEHDERSAAIDASGALDTDATRLANRLLMKTDALGNAGSQLGPYLSQWPQNPINRKSGVRIDGPLAGAGTHGRRFNSATGRIQSDHQALLAQGAGNPGPVVQGAQGAQVDAEAQTQAPGKD